MQPTTTNDIKPGFSALICGVSGTGKSYCQRTISNCKIPGTDKTLEYFTVVTDRHSKAIIQEDPRAHYIYIPPVGADWNVLRTAFKNTNELSYAALCDLKVGVEKKKCNQMLEVVEALNSFKCQHCNRNFGDVATWQTDRVLIFDHLSGISEMSRQLTVGLRQVMTQGEYGVAMQNIYSLLTSIIRNSTCHIAVMAHIEMEKDEVSGLIYQMVQTLGRKLAPELPKEFSDVIRTDKSGAKFFWTTIYNNMAVKPTNVELSQSLEPTFELLFNGWLKRGGQVVETK